MYEKKKKKSLAMSNLLCSVRPINASLRAVEADLKTRCHSVSSDLV